MESKIGPKAIIHLDHLVYNYTRIKNHIQGREVMAVVKADAYGHGAVHVAKALESAGVKWFLVFTPEEAIELRENGIEQKIMVACRLHKDYFESAIKYEFILNCSCLEDFLLLKSYHIENGVSPEFHLKIETGMSRLGASPDEYDQIFDELKQMKELRCSGIYSHFATADEGDLSYAEYQLILFKRALEVANKKELEFDHIHISNSGTVLNLPEAHYNLVRVGMLLYGALPSDEVPDDISLKPVMEFTGPVVNVRRVSKGTKVSYGGVWSAPKDTNIAVVQMGFADGFPRPWYEMGYVMYKGEKYPIAGRVCMDQFMVDFGDLVPEVGDHILCFGENEHGSIKIEEIAHSTQQTTYIILTGVRGRTTRIYSDN